MRTLLYLSGIISIVGGFILGLTAGSITGSIVNPFAGFIISFVGGIFISLVFFALAKILDNQEYICDYLKRTKESE